MSSVLDGSDAVAGRCVAAYFAGMAKRSAPTPDADSEAAALLAALRCHGAVLETSSPDAPLPPGVTHALVPGKAGPKLVEKRKSFL